MDEIHRSTEGKYALQKWHYEGLIMRENAIKQLQSLATETLWSKKEVRTEAVEVLKQLETNSRAYVPESDKEQFIYQAHVALLKATEVPTIKERLQYAPFDILAQIPTQKNRSEAEKLVAIEILKDRSVKGWFTSRDERNKALKALADVCNNKELVKCQNVVWKNAVATLAERTADSRIAVACYIIYIKT